MNRDLAQRLFDGNVRIEAAWPFPSSPASDALLGALEYREEALPAPIEALMKGWSEDEREELFDGGHRSRDAFDELCGNAFCKDVFGWLAVVATPVFTPHGDGASFSWGHHYTGLIFAPTADELLNAALEWAEQSYERDTASVDRSGEADETATQIAGSAEGESAVPAKQGDAQPSEIKPASHNKEERR